MPNLESKPVFVDTQQLLAEACQQLSGAGVLCIDTEFHRENSYYPHLGLIQVATNMDCYLIDPLALTDLSPFWDMIHRPEHLKVFHAGRQDVEIILRASGRIPEPLFDTQMAAALLGIGEQVSLAKLVNIILKTVLPKSESFSDWLSRPLTEKQLTYAAHDVIYLLPVFRELEKQLKEKSRERWLTEEQDNIYNPGTYEITTDAALHKVRGVNGLSRQQLAALRSLSACRERIAQRQDKPRRRVIPDEALIAFARMDKPDPESLGKIRGISSARIRAVSEELTDAWKQGFNSASSSWPQSKNSGTRDPGSSLRAELLSALVRLRADQEEISAIILAKRSDLLELATWAGNNTSPMPDIPCMQGWRRGLIGNEMLQLLHGKISLKLDPASGLPVIESNAQ